MTILLNNTGNPISRDERNKINENWQRIIDGLTNLQMQIKVLAGGNDVDELIQRLNDAIESANTAVQQAIDANNTATQEAIDANNTALQTALITISRKLEDIEKAISDSQVATSEANDAKQGALDATAQAYVTINNLQSLINHTIHLGSWNGATQYFKNNMVTYNGSTFIALQDNLNKVPPTLPTQSNAYWSLFAEKGDKGSKGDKGDTGAALSILGKLTDPSQLPPTGQAGQAYTVNGELYVWSENLDTWENVGNIKGEKGDTGLTGAEGKSAYEVAVANGFVGTQEQWLASLKGEKGDKGQDADLTEVNQEIANIKQTVTDNKTEVTEHLGQIDTRLTSLESGASGAKADLVGLTRELAYMKLKQDAVDRVEGGTVFADDFNGNLFGMTLDEINSRGFKIKNGKLVLLEVVEVPHNVTDSTVVASAHSTSGNGRKLVSLSNGWLVTVTKNATSDINFYLSKDKGLNWTLLCYGGFNVIDISLVSIGTVIYYFLTTITTDRFGMFDATTIPVGTNIQTETAFAPKSIDSGQSSYQSSSLKIDPINSVLHATWSSKNPTLQNSFNIRYANGTINADGSVLWGTVIQVTGYNTSGREGCRNPSIVINNNRKPVILCDIQTDQSFIAVVSTEFTDKSAVSGGDPSWGNKFIHNGGANNIQLKPSASVDRDGVIHVAWEGGISTNPSTSAIVYTVSSDIEGINWDAATILTPQYYRTDVSLSIDSKNDVFLLYRKYNGTRNQVSMLVKESDVWSAETDVTNIAGATNDLVQPASLDDKSLTFNLPPFIYMDYSSSIVKFTGDWVEHFEVQKTEATLVYDVPNTSFVGAYVLKEGGLSINGFLNGLPMEDELDGNEYEFQGRSLDDGTPVKLRLEISRPDTSGGENDAVTRILGGRA